MLTTCRLPTLAEVTTAAALGTRPTPLCSDIVSSIRQRITATTNTQRLLSATASITDRQLSVYISRWFSRAVIRFPLPTITFNSSIRSGMSASYRGSRNAPNPPELPMEWWRAFSPRHLRIHIINNGQRSGEAAVIPAIRMERTTLPLVWEKARGMEFRCPGRRPFAVSPNCSS